jgi:hypothetical protein
MRSAPARATQPKPRPILLNLFRSPQTYLRSARSPTPASPKPTLAPRQGFPQSDTRHLRRWSCRASRNPAGESSRRRLSAAGVQGVGKFVEKPGQIESCVDLPHQVIFWDSVAQMKLVEQLTTENRVNTTESRFNAYLN